MKRIDLSGCTPLQITLAKIGAYLETITTPSRKVEEVFRDKKAGLVVFKTTVMTPNTHKPEWMWYTVAIPNGWCTTATAKVGDLSTKFGTLPFKEILMTERRLILVVSDGTETITTEFEIKELRKYKSKKKQT